MHAVTAQVPIAAQAAEWATAWPIAFGVVTLLFWLWPAWSLLHVPRSLHIDRQGVRVGKLIWPFAKTFSLEQIEDVRVNEKQVVLLRRNASLLRRFIHAVPPMPSNEDARWLAAHIRRALIMFGGLQKKA